MTEHASSEMAPKITWEGKYSPFGVSYGKLMMWFFLFSDALTFGGFLTAYGYVRHSYTVHGLPWPVGEEYFFGFPFLSGEYPLMYVAFMTFLLIISSVTMVLAVEAGHRMSKKGVTRWLFATIIGGLIFVGSQAYEWAHFIHGTDFGKVMLHDGSTATVKGSFGEIKSFDIISAGSIYGEGDQITDDNIDKADKNLMHAFKDAAAHRRLEGKAGDLTITLSDGSVAKVNKEADEDIRLFVAVPGNEYSVSIPADESTRINEDEGSVELYYEALANGNVIYGANTRQNEYGPVTYADFFFFITGFHGFHVSIGIIINIVVFVNVLIGTYERRGHYEMVEKGGLYWHFVDLVWVFVFTFLYLI